MLYAIYGLVYEPRLGRAYASGPPVEGNLRYALYALVTA